MTTTVVFSFFFLFSIVSVLLPAIDSLILNTYVLKFNVVAVLFTHSHSCHVQETKGT